MSIFWKYLKSYKGYLFLALGLAIINQTFSLMDPQIIRLILDNYATRVSELAKREFVYGVGILLLGLVGVALVSRIAKNLQDYFVNVMTQKIGTKMYSNSIQHTFSLPFKIFEDRRSGEVLQKIQKAKTDLQSFITSFVNVVFLSFIGIIIVVGYAFYVYWSIGLAFAVIVPMIAGFIFVISKKIKQAQIEIIKESADLAGSTTETIRNVELVKSLGLEKQEIGRLNKVNEKILLLELKKVKLIRTLSFIQGTMINTVRVFLLFLMLYLLFDKTITIGEFMTLFFYSFFVLGPLGEISNVISQYQEARASIEQLEEIMNIEKEKKKEGLIEINDIEKIEFKNISFKYSSSNTSSLKDVDITINSGERVAFVGPSGSGKTTLIKLLLGLYKTSKGKLLINGIQTENIDYDKLRNKIGLVSQESQLFAGTIRENLRFVKPDAKDEECLEVLRAASAMTIIEKGGKGLDTKIGEGGIKLSGGEKQRISIARALLRNPELLIFDEATSALDSITEKSIGETLDKITLNNRKVLSIYVAHRLSTIRKCDRIYVLEKGEIVEKGNHQSLIKKKGLYYALWREQGGEI